MPMLKKANAIVTHPRVSGRRWDGVRRVASSGASTKNLTDQAREILGGPLDPDKYLFTHCTIVASVDTEKVPGVKLGKVKVGSTTVDRRYADYHIAPQCSQYVNNNGDSWSRGVLLASYPTFIGAHNFQEHVQVEDKSKGRIIDAVARDIGDSVYVDILVATALKHTSLISDIRAKKTSTLSMGCTTDFTICTKCGHFAIDETDLCDHIKVAKLNTFLDDDNKTRVIAELCGHVDYNENDDAPAGVQFIEASWVAVPAFQGAVMRNILKTGDIGESELRKLFAMPAPSWSEFAISKAASAVPLVGQTRQGFEFGGDDEGGGEEEKSAEPEVPFQDLEDALYQLVKDRVKGRLEKEMEEKAPESEALAASDWPNDTLNKEATPEPLPTSVPTPFRKEAQVRYRSSLNTLVRVASSDAALVDGIAAINQAYGVKVAVSVYRAALKAGASSQYSDPQLYIRACRKAAGRDLSPAELRVVVRVGTLLSRWESNNNPSNISHRSST